MNVENDKSSLLDSLKIERSAPVRRRGPSPWMYAGVVAAVIAAGGAGWYFWPDNSAAVHVVTAAALGSGGAAGTGLDASGYIVARRKATLSAKILGKLTEVNFEEGQKVKAGQIVARLDDSNYAAALEQAVQQERAAKQAYDDAAPIYTRYQRLKQEGAISTDALENERIAYDTARTAFDVAKAVRCARRSTALLPSRWRRWARSWRRRRPAAAIPAPASSPSWT
jgi:multidrug efflux pump subunit AcrA (membrane-fusion protein)